MWFIRGVKNNRHGLIMLFFMIIYIKIFGILEARQNIQFHIIHVPADDMIPFHEAFIIPYLLWFPFVIGTVAFFVFHKGPDHRYYLKEEYYRLAFNLIFGMCVFLLISWLYPNMVDLRPKVFPRDNFLTDCVKWLYRSDTCTNVFPSIHVFNSMACTTAVLCSPLLRKNRLAVSISCTMTGLVILATVFLKQHSLIDVIMGFILGMTGYFLFYNVRILDLITGKSAVRKNEAASSQFSQR